MPHLKIVQSLSRVYIVSQEESGREEEEEEEVEQTKEQNIKPHTSQSQLLTRMQYTRQTQSIQLDTILGRSLGNM